jgi:hypothetical protein
MHADQVTQFLDRLIGPVNLFAKPLKDLFGFVAEKLNQDVILVLEVKVYGTIGNPGLFGNLGNGGLVKTLPGKHPDGGLKNTMVFIIFVFAGDDRPPELRINSE